MRVGGLGGEFVIPTIMFVLNVYTLVNTVCMINRDRRRRGEAGTGLGTVACARHVCNRLVRKVKIASDLGRIIVDNSKGVGEFCSVTTGVVSSSVRDVRVTPGKIIARVCPRRDGRSDGVSLVGSDSEKRVSHCTESGSAMVVRKPLRLGRNKCNVTIHGPICLRSRGNRGDF